MTGLGNTCTYLGSMLELIANTQSGKCSSTAQNVPALSIHQIRLSFRTHHVVLRRGHHDSAAPLRHEADDSALLLLLLRWRHKLLLGGEAPAPAAQLHHATRTLLLRHHAHCKGQANLNVSQRTGQEVSLVSVSLPHPKSLRPNALEVHDAAPIERIPAESNSREQVDTKLTLLHHDLLTHPLLTHPLLLLHHHRSVLSAHHTCTHKHTLVQRRVCEMGHERMSKCQVLAPSIQRNHRSAHLLRGRAPAAEAAAAPQGPALPCVPLRRVAPAHSPSARCTRSRRNPAQPEATTRRTRL